MTPGQRDPRPTGFGPADHALAACWVVACLDQLAGAALAEAGKLAAGAAMLAGRWACGSVVAAGWTLAAVVMGAEWALGAPAGLGKADQGERGARQPPTSGGPGRGLYGASRGMSRFDARRARR